MTLVFIHGAGCDGAVWDAQISDFPGAFVVTLPGRPSSVGPATSIEEFADAVEAEIVKRDLGDAIVCGHSMGGAVALELALRRNPRVCGLAMLSSGAKLRVAPAVFDSLAENFAAGARTLAQLFFADPTPERVDAAATMMLAVGPDQTIRDFRACDAFNATDRLVEVAIPTLALVGERDAMTPPKYSLFLADRIPGATARILSGAGHMAMIERPVETNMALRAFVTQVSS